ncbi:MAG TPA: DUF4258 domain-containing protein [Solirubrobacterales bacterium]|nr:DUF4258 domain-containing protein [Solirubrobacterales bacterium]
MQFTKHAKNRLKLYKLTRADAEFIVANPLRKEREDDSKRRYLGQIEGKWIRVIVPDDDPNLIVSVHPRRHG